MESGCQRGQIHGRVSRLLKIKTWDQLLEIYMVLVVEKINNQRVNILLDTAYSFK